MGRERSWTRQFIFFCAAGLIVPLFAGCASFRAILEERQGRVHLQQERLLARQGDFEGAIRENRKILDSTPKSSPADAALFSMGLIFADNANPAKDYKRSLAFFRQLVSEFPQSQFAADARIWAGVLENEVSAERESRAHLQRMQILTRQGDFEGALRENLEVLASSQNGMPRDAALFSMGLIFADFTNPGKDYKKALDYFTQLDQDFPRSPFAEDGRVWAGILGNEVVGREGCAHLQRMQVLIRQGDFKGALQEDQKILSLSPKDPRSDGALFSMGLIFADHNNPEKDYRKALGFFAQLVKEFPESPLVEGARTWTRLLKNEVSPYAHLQQVQFLIHKGDFDGAIRECQNTLALSPKSPPGDAALFCMGLAHADHANPKMDYRKALNFFVRLKKEFPGSPFAEEARIWTGVLETMVEASRVDLEVEAKKKELRR